MPCCKAKKSSLAWRRSNDWSQRHRNGSLASNVDRTQARTTVVRKETEAREPALARAREPANYAATVTPEQPPHRTRKDGQKPTQCSSNRPREGEVAYPVEVASAALGFETIPPLLATSAENKTTLVVDTKVSAPNRYTKYQVGVLSAAYKMCTKPARKQHRELSETIGLTERQSKIWFQNKRQRQRNALSMSQNDTLKEEISEMLESLQNAKYRSHILEIENQGLNPDLKRKAAQLDELENLESLQNAKYRSH